MSSAAFAPTAKSRTALSTEVVAGTVRSGPCVVNGRRENHDRRSGAVRVSRALLCRRTVALGEPAGGQVLALPWGVSYCRE